MTRKKVSEIPGRKIGIFKGKTRKRAIKTHPGGHGEEVSTGKGQY
jgi:hypothetical protein